MQQVVLTSFLSFHTLSIALWDFLIHFHTLIQIDALYSLSMAFPASKCLLSAGFLYLFPCKHIRREKKTSNSKFNDETFSFLFWFLIEGQFLLIFAIIRSSRTVFSFVWPLIALWSQFHLFLIDLDMKGLQVKINGKASSQRF